jgi:hypothetical protein
VLNEELGHRVIIGYLLTCKKGGKRNNINNDSIHFNSIIYYICAGTTATRSITEAALEHKENTKIQTTKEITYKRYNKKSHIGKSIKI